jgi:glycosyltransferase involved in cell wall biosynthesis
MKIVIISPTYNEKINITKMIPVLLEEVFPKIKNHDMYLLIVDDTSPDGTGDVELEVLSIVVLNEATTPAFDIATDGNEIADLCGLGGKLVTAKRNYVISQEFDNSKGSCSSVVHSSP